MMDTTILDEDRCIKTYTGKWVDPFMLRPEDVDLIDIAHALSLVCRYTGHCREFYSVAQHSVIVSCLVDEKNALAALLHDASEAYIADIAKPVKPRIEGYQALEDSIMGVVFQSFGIKSCDWDDIRGADRMTALAEWDALMEDTYEGVTEIHVKPWTPEQAERTFLQRYKLIRKAEKDG